MQTFVSAVAIVLALAFSPMAFATLQSENSEDLARGADSGTVTADSFARQRQQLIEEIESGDAYVEITAMQKREVHQSLNRMQSWLESAGSVEAMDENQRIRLLNEQEKINTMLTGVAADSRLVCTREQPVGSRMRQTVCFTEGERRRRRELDTEGANRYFIGNTGR